jgi:hypothetical protein
LEAIQDGSGSHDLDIILVSRDGKMSRPGKGIFNWQALRDKYFCGTQMQFHGGLLLE